MSSLRKYQRDPKYLINNALQLFKSKRIQTIIVEGLCDKRFLSQWKPINKTVRFDGLEGKPLVEQVYKKSQLDPYSDYNFLYFLVDIDFDIVTESYLYKHANYVYNAFCHINNKLHFNDLESYLINTNAFEKVLVNLDINTEAINDLRLKIEKASRFIGKLRAADIIVQKKLKLRSSILNGLEIRGFFNSSEINFNERVLLSSLPRWSNYPEYIDELIDTAQTIDRQFPTLWALSRGHDLTEMLALHLESCGHKGMTAEKIELMLRLGCEFRDFQNSPMGRQLSELWQE